MSARTTMAALIQQVRDLTDAGTAIWTQGTANYFDDDHVQGLLDRNRIDIYHEPLTVFPKFPSGGSIQWFEYRSQYGDLEQTLGGTSIFIVEDATGADAATANWSADYTRGIVTFGADQRGTAYFLTARSYDLYGAAADLLTQWASHEKLSFDFATDGQSFKRSQKAGMLVQMADEYRRQQRPTKAIFGRSDVADSPQLQGPMSEGKRKEYGSPGPQGGW